MGQFLHFQSAVIFFPLLRALTSWKLKSTLSTLLEHLARMWWLSGNLRSPRLPFAVVTPQSTVWCGDNWEEVSALIPNGALSAAWKWHSLLVFTQAQLWRFISVADNQLEQNYARVITQIKGEVRAGAVWCKWAKHGPVEQDWEHAKLPSNSIKTPKDRFKWGVVVGSSSFFQVWLILT